MWAADIACIEQFCEFKNRICDAIQLDAGTANDGDIIAAIHNHRRGFNDQMELNQQLREFVFTHLGVSVQEQQMSGKVAARISGVNTRLNDLFRFTRVARNLLRLADNTPYDVCLNIVLKVLEERSK